MLGLLGVLTAAICASGWEQPVPTDLLLGMPHPKVEQERRWMGFGGTGWSDRVRLTLLTQGTKQSPVAATPPDSTPAFASDPAYIVKLPTSRIAWVRDLLVVQFAAAATQLHKDSIITSVSGVVVGGKPSSMEGGGFYMVRLPADTTHARLTAAESALRSNRLVRRAVRYFSLGLDPTFGVANDVPSGRQASGHVGTQKPTVPATAPDSLPTSLINSLPLLTDESGNRHRSELVLLSFRSGTPQPARQAAITRVGGVVIGGKAGIQMEGWYLIRVASANTLTAIRSVTARLRAEPSVELVGPFTLGFPDDESRRRPDDAQATQQQVPAVPPDTLPIDIAHDSNVVSVLGLAPYPFIRDVVWVQFKSRASTAARSLAIARVNGIVIGGYRIGQSGGMYAVKLPKDPTHQATFRARDLLASDSAVAGAMLEFLFKSRRTEVPATPPDHTPEFVFDPAFNVQLPGSRISFVRDLLVVQFADSTTLAQRDSLVASVNGVVVGGSPSSMEGGGFYVVRLPADSTHARLAAAEAALKRSALVRRATRYWVIDFGPTSRSANVGPNLPQAPGAADTSGLAAVASANPVLRLSTATQSAVQPVVPAKAPDSLPTSLINSLPLLTDQSGNQHRSQLVMLSFFERASQPVRQAVIRSVGGMVVGGKAGIQEEGWHLVRVASATSMAAIDSVVATLRANPSVELVGPFTLGFPDDESKQSVVPAMAPDSVPFPAISRLFYPANGGWPYAQDVLMLRFRLGTPVRERSRVTRLVSVTVIGGKRDVTAEGGVYVIGLPRDSTQATLLAARDLLRSENALLTVWLYEFLPVDPTNRIPNDALDRSAQGPSVPPIAPDTIPRWLFDDSSLVANPDFPSGRFMRGIVSVLFKSEATLADRQAAVAAVDGVVIGGARLLGTDGYYIIRLMSDTSVRAPFKAVKVLRGLGQVDDANVEWVSARPERSDRVRRP